MANAFTNIGSGVPTTGLLSGLKSSVSSGIGQMMNPTPPQPALGSLGTTAVVKHTIGADGSQTVTHAQDTGTTKGALTPNVGSVVDYLNSTGKASDYNTRSGLASQYGIQGYSGTADQNTQLLNALKGGQTVGAINTGNGINNNTGGNTQMTPEQFNQANGTTPSQSYTGTTPAPGYNTDGTNKTLPIDYSGTNQAQTSGMVNQNTPYVPPNQGTTGVSQGGLIGNLANYGAGYESPEVAKARQDLLDAQKQFAGQTKDINTSGTWTSRALGEQGQANIANASVLDALKGNVTNALTSQGQQIGALGTAVGANAPQFPSYSSQVYSPSSGFQQGGNTLNGAVANVVQKLQSGQMTYNDAVSALSGYGQGGINALQQALPPGFNIAQSNTLAGQQGSIGVNYQLADTALKNVESIIGQLMPSQNTNIPLINKAGNWFSTQFGINSKETRAMTGAVQSLRNAYASLLASAKGGTPTDYSGQAQAEIPNEPTPNDIAAIRQNFETLGKARASILGNPGQSGTETTKTGSSLYSW